MQNNYLWKQCINLYVEIICLKAYPVCWIVIPSGPHQLSICDELVLSICWIMSVPSNVFNPSQYGTQKSNKQNETALHWKPPNMAIWMQIQYNHHINRLHRSCWFSFSPKINAWMGPYTVHYSIWMILQVKQSKYKNMFYLCINIFNRLNAFNRFYVTIIKKHIKQKQNVLCIASSLLNVFSSRAAQYLVSSLISQCAHPQ